MAIHPDLLRSVRTIVTHDRCSDGLGSAMVLRDALPHAAIRFALHGTPSHDALDADPFMLFCDIAPPPGREREFLEAGAIVLDHHKGAESIVAKFVAAGIGAFADEKLDPGISGTTLAYREVWLKLRDPERHQGIPVAEFARHVGIRDTWQTSSPDWGAAQVYHHALVFYPREHYLIDHEPYLRDEELAIGRVVIERHRGCVERAAAAAHRDDVDGTSVAVFNEIGLGSARLTSDVAEKLRPEGVRVVAGFHYEGRQLMVSLRTDGTIDAASIAKRHGGGGHTAAAGFRIDDRGNPFERVLRALSGH